MILNKMANNQLIKLRNKGIAASNRKIQERILEENKKDGKEKLEYEIVELRRRLFSLKYDLQKNFNNKIIKSKIDMTEKELYKKTIQLEQYGSN